MLTNEPYCKVLPLKHISWNYASYSQNSNTNP